MICYMVLLAEHQGWIWGWGFGVSLCDVVLSKCTDDYSDHLQVLCIYYQVQRSRS